jgi:hypothetical protein
MERCRIAGWERSRVPAEDGMRSKSDPIRSPIRRVNCPSRRPRLYLGYCPCRYLWQQRVRRCRRLSKPAKGLSGLLLNTRLRLGLQSVASWITGSFRLAGTLEPRTYPGEHRPSRAAEPAYRSRIRLQIRCIRARGCKKLVKTETQPGTRELSRQLAGLGFAVRTAQAYGAHPLAPRRRAFFCRRK